MSECKCRYYCGATPKRILCDDGCFIQFVDGKERQKFYKSRCCGEASYRCNIKNVLDERKRSGGASQ